MDSQGNVRAAGRGVQDSGSVLIKLSHRDPAKAVIKKHNSLVLRAESPADKYSWLVRLKRCAQDLLLVTLECRYATVLRLLEQGAYQLCSEADCARDVLRN